MDEQGQHFTVLAKVVSAERPRSGPACPEGRDSRSFGRSEVSSGLVSALLVGCWTPGFRDLSQAGHDRARERG